MSDEPRFSAYHLILQGELTGLEFEDDLEPGTVVDVLRELSQRLAELADYYEDEGTDSLFGEGD